MLEVGKADIIEIEGLLDVEETAMLELKTSLFDDEVAAIIEQKLARSGESGGLGIPGWSSAQGSGYGVYMQAVGIIASVEITAVIPDVSILRPSGSFSIEHPLSHFDDSKLARILRVR